MLLDIKNLNVYYGNAQVLHENNLSIQEGEIVFLVGRNGAGKTTLLKTISGFLTPLSGDITFKNNNLNDKTPDEIARLGIRYVFQDKRVISNLTVRENIELAAYPTRENVNDAVDKVINIYPKIEEYLNIKAHSLSGGQRQLLLIGRALIGNPKLILIDEPTEGLAIGIIKDVMEVLRNLEGNITLFIVEQNLNVVSKLADRVYIMKEGKISKEVSQEDINVPEKLEGYL